jgi:hypothetical protein
VRKGGWGTELFADYHFDEKLIRVWMRTAIQESFRPTSGPDEFIFEEIAPNRPELFSSRQLRRLDRLGFQDHSVLATNSVSGLFCVG